MKISLPRGSNLRLAREAERQGDLEKCLEFLHKARPSDEKQGMLGIVNYKSGKKAISNQQYGLAEKRFSECAEVVKNTNPDLSFFCQRRVHILRQFSKNRQAFDPETTLDEAHIKKVRKLLKTQFYPLVNSVSCVAAYRPMRDKEFDDELSKLIRLAKRGIDTQHIKRLGEMLAACVFRENQILEAVDLVIPVPTSPDRMCERGYSIPQLLAEKFSELTAIPDFPNWVESEITNDVRGVPKWLKKNLLEGAFSVNDKKDRLNNLNVLIIDDVITTGTTVKEFASTLRNKGVSEVHALALAHTECSPKYEMI